MKDKNEDKHTSSVRRNRRISIRSERRKDPDVKKLGSALLSIAQAEADAQAEHTKAKEQRSKEVA